MIIPNIFLVHNLQPTGLAKAAKLNSLELGQASDVAVALKGVGLESLQLR